MEKKISPVKQRILLYADYKGFSKRSIYLKTGIANGTLDKETGLSETNIEKFISTFDEVRIEWLVIGEGKMLKDKAVPISEVNDPAEPYDKSIPLYPIAAFAGQGNIPTAITESNIMGRYVIPDFIDAEFMIRIKGSSMYPKYSSGDIVACKMLTDRSLFQWGRVFVLHHREQGTMVKRLFPTDQPDVIECKSDNDHYPPFNVALTDITNFALVIGVVRLE